MSSYEADANIYATGAGVSSLLQCGRSIDLLSRMPRHAFYILGMFHEYAHAFKVSVRLGWCLMSGDWCP